MASTIKVDTIQSTTSNVIIQNSVGTEYARFDATGVFQLANPSTFPAGTAAAPSITATGDTNTGIFFPAADTIAFSEGGAESMRIDSSGNVGIGTSSPANLLTVQTTATGTTAGSNIIARLQSNATGRAATLQFSDNVTNSATISMVSGATAFGQNGTEAMRIDSSGNLLLNTSSTLNGTLEKFQLYPATSGASQYGMMVGGNAQGYTVYAMRFLNTYTPAVVGSITIGTTSTAYNTSSDYRLKNSVAPMTGALAKVAALKPVTYKWNADDSDGEGFIAHELAEVMPQAVTGEKDGVETYTDEEGNEQTRPVYQGIDTSFLVATLTAAIQELKTINDTQAETINALTANLTALTARITALESTP